MTGLFELIDSISDAQIAAAVLLLLIVFIASCERKLRRLQRESAVIEVIIQQLAESHFELTKTLDTIGRSTAKLKQDCGAIEYAVGKLVGRQDATDEVLKITAKHLGDLDGGVG